MKHSIFIFTLVAAIIAGNHSYAKGGHACGHASHIVFIHSSSHSKTDNDMCKQLRGDICSGYVVYKADTLPGIIVCSDNAVSYKANAAQDSSTVYNLADSNLKIIRLANKNEQIEFVRLGRKDKKLYRLVHKGRLSIYDDSYSFLFDKKNIKLDDMKFIYNDRVEDMNRTFTINSKRKLVQKINAVYDTDLDPKDYSKAELYNYISKLN